MRRFGGERLQPGMDRAGLDEAPLEFSMLSKAIGSVQERVEGYNFDIRKHVWSTTTSSTNSARWSTPSGGRSLPG
jgi:preprotein translocase subunit SecA